jgi:hypothetical protein
MLKHFVWGLCSFVKCSKILFEAFAALQNAQTFCLGSLQLCKMVKHFVWGFCSLAKWSNILFD